MKPKVLLVACFLACLLTGSVYGAVVGSITGTVVDAQTKEPLAGVSVSISGTTMGAKTDLDGRYNILNVPVGAYTLIFTSVGYARVEIADVRVSADLATFQSREMEQETMETGRVITVTAERPMIIKDKTTTVSIVDREQLLTMPTRGFEQVVGIQNSVVRMNSNVDTRQRGFRESVSSAQEINLRGGRPSEVAYYVDGFSQQDPLTGISTANISNNAVKEISITTGAFNAEYGHVAGGIVNVTTNSGTDKLHGNLEGASDNIATPFGYNSYDQNYYSGDVGGPIPNPLIERAYFFFSGERRFLKDRSPSVKTKEFYEEFGLDDRYGPITDDPQRLPSNSSSGWSYQGKLDFDIMSNFKLMISGNGSIEKWQEYRHSYMNPAFPDQIKHSPKYDDRNQGLNAKITHTLNPNTFYSLSASHFRTERHRGDGIIFDQYPAYYRTVPVDTADTATPYELANPEWDYYNLFREGDTVYASDLKATIDPGSADDTLIGFFDSYWANFMRRKATYLQFKGDITHQTGTHLTVKFGFDFQRHTVRYFENLAAPDKQDTLSTKDVLNRYGYDRNGMPSDNESFLNNTKHPINFGVYLQNRFDWRGFIVNAGLRFDYFDYRSLRIINLEYPFDPTGGSDPYIDESDLAESEKFSRLSPRLGISFPVSDRTQMHVGYAKYFQRPDLVRLYLGYDFLEARVSAGSYYPFPSPNLEPERITTYELGLTQQLADNLVFTLSGYYRDNQGLTQIFHQDPGNPRNYDFFSNTDYGTTKGVDINLNMRRTRHISFDFKYTLCYATGTGSYAQSGFNIFWKNPQGPPKTTSPLDYDQRHSIIGLLNYQTNKNEGPKVGDTYILENVTFTGITQIASGLPYTPTQVYDAVSPNASVDQLPEGGTNSSNGPWTWSINIRLERKFKTGNIELVPYLWVNNLLNTENIIAVYEGTGKADISGYLETQEGQTRASDPAIDPTTGRTRGEEFAYRYDFGQKNPNNYLNPRIIIVGLRMSF